MHKIDNNYGFEKTHSFSRSLTSEWFCILLMPVKRKLSVGLNAVTQI